MSDTPIYIEVAVKVQPLEPFRDILLPSLAFLVLRASLRLRMDLKPT